MLYSTSLYSHTMVWNIMKINISTGMPLNQSILRTWTNCFIIFNRVTRIMKHKVACWPFVLLTVLHNKCIASCSWISILLSLSLSQSWMLHPVGRLKQIHYARLNPFHTCVWYILQLFLEVMISVSKGNREYLRKMHCHYLFQDRHTASNRDKLQ